MSASICPGSCLLSEVIQGWPKLRPQVRPPPRAPNASLRRTCKSLLGYTSRITHQCLSRETVRLLENEQSDFKTLVASSKEYSETEKTAVNVATLAEFNAFWQNTNDAKKDFDQSHERGCGLCSKTYQSSAVLFRKFMNDFSPILDIVQNFASPYGGMAVGPSQYSSL